MNIDKNSFVTIDYLINLGEAETYPPDGKPEEISFCMGWGAMPPGLEEALIGMKVNDAKVINLSAEQAYGEFDDELLMEVPRSDFGRRWSCARAWYSRPRTKTVSRCISSCKRCSPKQCSSTLTIPWRAKTWKFPLPSARCGRPPLRISKSIMPVPALNARKEAPTSIRGGL